jgi:hypothetical protein
MKGFFDVLHEMVAAVVGAVVFLIAVLVVLAVLIVPFVLAMMWFAKQFVNFLGIG